MERWSNNDPRAPKAKSRCEILEAANGIVGKFDSGVTSGTFALDVGGQSTISAPGSTDARLQRVIARTNGMIFSPTLKVAYLHEFSAYRSQIATLVALPGTTFLIDGARPSRDAAI